MTGKTPWQVRDLLNRETPFLPEEVASLFNVDPRTVTRWANQGKIKCFRTLGGHRRYPAEEIKAMWIKLGLDPREMVRKGDEQ